MTKIDLLAKLDETIKQIWKEDISIDNKNDCLLLEDSLKCAFYYHLRTRLGDGWFKNHRVRIYPEYHLSIGKKADIAIVLMIPAPERLGKHLSKSVESELAIIEFKYKNASVDQPFFDDKKKLYEYFKAYPDTKLYAAFIRESENDLSWFDKRQTENWGKGRLTELLGYWDENCKLETRVNEY